MATSIDLLSLPFPPRLQEIVTVAKPSLIAQLMIISVCVLFYKYMVIKERSTGLKSVGVSSVPFLAKFRSALYFRTLLKEANHKYLSKGHICSIPDFFFGPLVVLPHSQLKWLRSQSSQILHPTKAQHELAQMKYLAWFSKTPFLKPLEGWHARRWVAIRFESTKTSINKTLSEALKLSWGEDVNEWKEFRLYDSVVPIMTRAVWESFVGAPWCNDAEIIRNASRFASLIFPLAQLVRAFPNFLQPMVGSVVRLPLTFMFAKIRQRLHPVIEQRIIMLQDPALDEKSIPNDYVSWLLYRDIKEGQINKETTNKICSQLIGLTFAATQSVSITASNALWFLLCSPLQPDYVESIRAETQQIIAEHGEWTKKSLEKAVLLNASIRETMRMLPGTLVASVRLLECDILLPTSFDVHGHKDATNVLMKKGTKLGLPSYTIHNDPSIYPHPEQFDPFRHLTTTVVDGQSEITTTPLVTLTDDWIAWGVGKGACPGRYIANDVMKLLLIEMLSQYEIKPVGNVSRVNLAEKAPCLGPFKFPNVKATVMVKRKHIL